MSNLTSSNFENNLITILIAEQDQKLLSMLEMLFSAGGYEVFCAETGQAALEQAGKFRYPLIISGLDFPDMPGTDLLAGLTEIDPYIECIILAEVSELTRVIEASEIGNVYNHFWKPLKDMGEVVRTVARALERRELRLNNAHLLTELREARESHQNLFRHIEYLNKKSGIDHLAQNSSAVKTQSIEQEGNLNGPSGESMLQYVLKYAREQDNRTENIQIRPLFDEIAELVSPLLRDQSITINFDTPENLPDIHLNRPRLRQILAGIILNSVQSFPSAGGTITIKIRVQKKSDESNLLISIKDDGSGVSDEVLPHVFDPFFSTRPREVNLGIGLTIARKILHEWDGNIDIQSEETGGTEVIVTLPIHGSISSELHNSTDFRAADAPPDKGIDKYAA